MKEYIFNTDDDRGQVGIGTLIVFIALVLVAAIAAGVLINTAGFLQTQAEATGEESTQQVSDNLDIESVLGNASSGQVDDIEVVVSQSPGADDINLSEMTIDYLGPDGAATLTHDNSGDVASGNYNLSVVTAEAEGDNILSDNADRYKVTLELNGTDEGAVEDSLQSSEDAELLITTPQGSQRTIIVSVPDSLTHDGDYRL